MPFVRPDLCFVRSLTYLYADVSVKLNSLSAVVQAKCVTVEQDLVSKSPFRDRGLRSNAHMCYHSSFHRQCDVVLCPTSLRDQALVPKPPITMILLPRSVALQQSCSAATSA